MKRWIVCAGFLALVVGGGLTIGAVTAPGEWYAQLSKPPFNPPGYLFGPVWTVLYVLIAIAGWRTWEREAAMPMKLWWVQLALNFSWSPAFFAAHRIGIALLIVLLLLGTIGAFIALSWRQDRLTAWLFVPYAAWVAFAQC
jgi:tryptophan-rich sensory protein